MPLRPAGGKAMNTTTAPMGVAGYWAPQAPPPGAGGALVPSGRCRGLFRRREGPEEPTMVEVARQRLDPRGGDSDEGLREVLVREADGLQHGSRAGPIGAVGQGGGMTLGRVAGPVVRTAVGSVGHRAASSRWE